LAAPGTSPAAAAAGWGTLTSAGLASAAAGALTVCGDGKKVGFLPLWICHLSQSKTMEKPNITHSMVRRISFMKTS
jgi:hypothetical protein